VLTKSWAICLLLALPFLTSCATSSGSGWKERVLGCRKPPVAPLPAEPFDSFLACPDWSLQVLGAAIEDRSDDTEEWACIADL
jgi:hypothetical protein